jgi:hypothetical protein
MKRMAWIAVAAMATLMAAPALADSRQTTEDQPLPAPSAQSGATQSGGSQSGDTPSDDSQSGSGQKGGDNSGGSGDNSGGGQQAAPASPTMKELLASGYEVKSTMLIPRDVVKRGGATDAVDAVIITMQDGAALATCYEEFSSFVTDPTTLACNLYK